MSAVVPAGVVGPTAIVLAMVLDDSVPSVTVQPTVRLRSPPEAEGLPLVELKVTDSRAA